MKIGQKQGWKQTWITALVLAVGTAGAAHAQDKVAKPTGEHAQDQKHEHGQPEKKDGGAGGMDDMAEWAAANMPNENHTLLGTFAGTWSVTNKMMMDPTQPPVETKATFVATSTFDGRYVTGVYSGDFEGMKFQGVATWAYNNSTRQFESTWIDSMSTGIAFSTGTYDKASKTLTMAGKMDMPDGTKALTKETTQFVNDDTFVMKFYEITSDGKENLQMEMTYTRISKDAKGAMKRGETTGEKVMDKTREKANDAKDKGEKKLRDTLPR